MKEEEATDTSAGPNESEKKRSVLSFFISLLNDDLRCWMRFAHNHSTLLRAKTDVPLIVRLFWSQDGTTVGFINSICREFITIHLKALVCIASISFILFRAIKNKNGSNELQKHTEVKILLNFHDSFWIQRIQEGSF